MLLLWVGVDLGVIDVLLYTPQNFQTGASSREVVWCQIHDTLIQSYPWSLEIVIESSRKNISLFQLFYGEDCSGFAEEENLKYFNYKPEFVCKIHSLHKSFSFCNKENKIKTIGFKKKKKKKKKKERKIFSDLYAHLAREFLGKVQHPDPHPVHWRV